jgi:hypothetical protein
MARLLSPLTSTAEPRASGIVETSKAACNEPSGGLRRTNTTGRRVQG